MSVGKIAAGVFLGNLLFSVLAFIVISLFWDRHGSSFEAAAAHERLEAIQRQYPDAAAAERNSQ
jgi:hypothetical protein